MWDEEIEKAMLYYIIFEHEDYLLDENDFVGERNQKIIKAINELKAEKQDISIMSIKSKIKANSKQVLDYLATLGEYIRIASGEEVYTRLIELSKKRKLVRLLDVERQEIIDCENIDIVAERIIKEISKVEQINEKEKTFLQQVVDVTEQIEKNTLKGTDYSLYTGITDLDNMMCGLHRQELTIIGARPRSGKNNASTTNSRTYCRKRNRNSFHQLRNVRLPNNTKNAN